MSILKLFSGPSPEKLEQKGDALFEAKRWGQAKQAYDHALYKLEKLAGLDTSNKNRIEAKILRTRNALGQAHQQNAENYLEGGHFDEARELLSLALEITADDQLKQEIRDQLHSIELRRDQETDGEPSLLSNGQEDPDEYFFALCGTLPEEVQDAYLEYGENFKTGYIALNRGDFQTAALNLSRAMEENPQPDNFIPLELAAAYLNLGRLPLAQELLENFLQYHPEALPAYQLLCEIYWEQKDFLRVDALLGSVPDDLTESLAVILLKGRTLLHAGNFADARNFYNDFLDTYGWNDTVAGELAIVHELMDEPDKARHIYKEVMDQCNSCHARIDPMIKHKYAELSFAADMLDTDILEMYISLAREIPGNAAQYFDRISQIYQAQGNTTEAERFRSFSIRAEAKRGEPPR